MTPIEPRQRRVVAVDTCFAIYVARQKGVQQIKLVLLKKKHPHTLLSLAHPPNQAMSGAYGKAGESKCRVDTWQRRKLIRMAKTKFEKHEPSHAKLFSVSNNKTLACCI